jgi:MerR family transcriptional regulator, light-induced transcriptional regulator
MSGAGSVDRQMLQVAFSEIETISRKLPDSTLAALAQEVVQRVAQNLVPEQPGVALSSHEIDKFCDALLSGDPNAAASYILDAQNHGSSYHALCQSYIGRAASRLGEWWDADKISFYSVTIAAGRIYAILRLLRLNHAQSLPDQRRAAIFASVPGENHTLGITIATDLARDVGWDIELFVGLSHDELVEKFLQRKPTVIGLSASGKRALPALTQLIVALRITNPAARILVCGQIASSNLHLVGLSGADAAATDFESAITQMERLLDLQTRLPN